VHILIDIHLFSLLVYSCRIPLRWINKLHKNPDIPTSPVLQLSMGTLCCLHFEDASCSKVV